MDGTMITIRMARLSDAADVLMLERACFGGKALPMITIVQYLELFAASSLIACRGGKPVGALIAGASATQPESSWILDVAVHPDARGEGIGSAMLQRVLALFRAHAGRTVRASVSPDNAPSLTLFRRAGFSIVRTEPAYFGEGEPRQILVLEL